MTQEALHRIFTDIPPIETERLLLRRLSVNDAEDMYRYSSLAEVVQYLLWDAHPSVEYTKNYLEYLESQYALGNFYDWALVNKQDGKMIGTCGFTSIDPVNNNAEIGYVLNPAYRGRGLAPEAARAVIAFGFDTLGLERISAVCMVENIASLRVMQKVGLRKEGKLLSAVRVKGAYKDVFLSALISSERI